MNYLLILLDGKAAPGPVLDAMDALASNARLGVIEGWEGLESLMPEEDGGGLVFTCGAVSLDGERNVGSFLAPGEVEELLETVNNAQIDGVNFSAALRGKDIFLELEGEGLSARVCPNSCTPGIPLAQVAAAASGKGDAARQAKKTASALNKLIYRTARKSGRALFIRKVGARKAFPEGLDVLEPKGEAGVELLARIRDPNTVTVALQPNGSLARVLIHGGGLIGSGSKKFCEAACSRGFCLRADGLLPWVMRATKGSKV